MNIAIIKNKKDCSQRPGPGLDQGAEDFHYWGRQTEIALSAGRFFFNAKHRLVWLMACPGGFFSHLGST